MRRLAGAAALRRLGTVMAVRRACDGVAGRRPAGPGVAFAAPGGAAACLRVWAFFTGAFFGGVFVFAGAGGPVGAPMGLWIRPPAR
jgi:hypothetical protein